MVLQKRHGQNSGESCTAQQDRSSPGYSLAAPTRQHHRRDREALRYFVQEYRNENYPSQAVRNNEARGNSDSVEKSVNHQAKQYRQAFVCSHELVMVSFLAEMKMRGDRVLEE